jgi:hypothetical protein
VNEADWEVARLIPVSGINGSDEQERRGSSALLAVLASVREFGRAITVPLGAPSGTIETFIEVPFLLGERTVRPDGVIRVTRGKQTWRALVEVKTARNDLQTAQIEAYLDVAREHEFDAVLTISNQLVSAPGEHPTAVDRKKLRKVALLHMSWSQIHTEAVIERVNRSVSDPDQAWILDELIRYLEHNRSGAVDFEDMGRSWVAVREGVVNRTLRSNDPAAADVAARFGQLVAFAAMRLSRDLGVEVRPAFSKSDLKDFSAYLQNSVFRLVDGGMLAGALRVPNAIAPMSITADLRSGKITCSIDVAAPTQGRNVTRVNWLTRQLSKAPDALLIEAWTVFARAPGACHPIADVRARPELIFDDAKKELRSFTVRLSAVAGTKRGSGRGSFVESVLALVDSFYERVVQHIKPWMPPAPAIKARQPSDEPDAERDDITGELPLKSVQRASATPDWKPPETRADSSDELMYTTDGAMRPRLDADVGDEAAPAQHSSEDVGNLDSNLPIAVTADMHDVGEQT